MIIFVYIIPQFVGLHIRATSAYYMHSFTGGFLHVYYILKKFKPHHCNVDISNSISNSKWDLFEFPGEKLQSVI